MRSSASPRSSSQMDPLSACRPPRRMSRVSLIRFVVLLSAGLNIFSSPVGPCEQLACCSRVVRFFNQRDAREFRDRLENDIEHFVAEVAIRPVETGSDGTRRVRTLVVFFCRALESPRHLCDPGLTPLQHATSPHLPRHQNEPKSVSQKLFLKISLFSPLASLPLKPKRSPSRNFSRWSPRAIAVTRGRHTPRGGPCTIWIVKPPSEIARRSEPTPSA